LLAARPLLAGGGALVIIDAPRRFYPPAAAALGLALENMIVVRPTTAADRDWAFDQALRSRGVAAVWGDVPRTDSRTLRRWQLAAEASGVVGLLMRPDEVRQEPSWAELRLEVAPLVVRRWQPGRVRRLQVSLLRARAGPTTDRAIALEIPTLAAAASDDGRAAVSRSDHETRAVHLASQLAAAKNGRGSRRA
jgi:protein ImuA